MKTNSLSKMDIWEQTIQISWDNERLDCAGTKVLDNYCRDEKENNIKSSEEEVPCNIFQQWRVPKEFQLQKMQRV